jgi:hypothetical protein
MKKVLAALAAIVATAAVAVGTAGAEGSADPLLVITGEPCGVLDRDGSGIVTTDMSFIWYQSGKAVLRCQAQGTPGSTVVTFSGFGCSLGPLGDATHSKNVIRREGHIQLVCTADVNPGDVIDSLSSTGFGA